jgi:hypothetical protein
MRVAEHRNKMMQKTSIFNQKIKSATLLNDDFNFSSKRMFLVENRSASGHVLWPAQSIISIILTKHRLASRLWRFCRCRIIFAMRLLVGAS